MTPHDPSPQDSPVINAESVRQRPRRAPHAEHDGSYEIALRVLDPVINRGEWITIEQFITGYGNLTGMKIVAYPSARLFDNRQSKVRMGMGPTKSGIHVFGVVDSPFNDDGITLHPMGDVNATGIPMFFDLGTGRVPQLLSETKQSSAPFTYVLKTVDAIRPGKYSLDFHMTYHDGTKWKSSTRRAEFQVRNFLERYAVQIGIVALLASSISALQNLGILDRFRT